MKDIPYQLPHKGTGIEGIYSARQTERERETEAKERQVVWVERLWVGCSRTELLQRLSHSNQREREREREQVSVHFGLIQTQQSLSHLSVSLSGSWSQVPNESVFRTTAQSILCTHTHTHSQPVLINILIHTLIDGHFLSRNPCWEHMPYPLVIVTHTHTHSQANQTYWQANQAHAVISF